MKHKHEYEAVYHPSPTEVKALGNKEGEIRRRKTCNKEIILEGKLGTTTIFLLINRE